MNLGTLYEPVHFQGCLSLSRFQDYPQSVRMAATNTGQTKESYGREKGNQSVADCSQEWIFRSHSADRQQVTAWLLGFHWS